jgi:hypothetical protein
LFSTFKFLVWLPSSSISIELNFMVLFGLIRFFSFWSIFVHFFLKIRFIWFSGIKRYFLNDALTATRRRWISMWRTRCYIISQINFLILNLNSELIKEPTIFFIDLETSFFGFKLNNSRNLFTWKLICLLWTSWRVLNK